MGILRQELRVSGYCYILNVSVLHYSLSLCREDGESAFLSKYVRGAHSAKRTRKNKPKAGDGAGVSAENPIDVE